jgi:hypothetical protein
MKTIVTLREEAKAALGYSYTVIADLSNESKEVLYDKMADIAIADYGAYDIATQNWAISRRSGGFYATPLASQSFVDAAGIFVGEMGNQAVDLNAKLNPFSERNRGWVLGAAVAGLAVYFLAPLALAALRNTK